MKRIRELWVRYGMYCNAYPRKTVFMLLSIGFFVNIKVNDM